MANDLKDYWAKRMAEKGQAVDGTPLPTTQTAQTPQTSTAQAVTPSATPSNPLYSYWSKRMADKGLNVDGSPLTSNLTAAPNSDAEATSSGLRATSDKWQTTKGSVTAYWANHDNPDFVYDENVNRNQYKALSELKSDYEADIKALRQGGDDVKADQKAYNLNYIQTELDKLENEYKDNKAPEAPAVQGLDLSIQKTLGAASDYSREIARLNNKLAMLESTNHWGAIGQDYDSQTGETTDIEGWVNNDDIRRVKEEIRNAEANKAAAERAEQREGLKANADYTQNSATTSSLADNPEAQKLIGGRNVDAVSGEEYTEKSAIDLLGYASDEENQMFNYILNTQGEEAAKEYIDDLRYDLNARQASAKSQEASQYADENGFKASAKSVGQNLISGAGLLDTTIQNAYRKITGNNRRIDYNTWANQQSQQVQATRGTVAQELTDKYGSTNILGKEVSVGDLYQLGMSMADSGASALLGGGTGLGSSTALLLGASAGTQATQEAVRNGATDDQALALGWAAAAAETITEKYSLENLISAPGKSILKNMARQAGVEASEEAASTILNTLADETIRKEDSEYNRRIRELEASGMSSVEANNQAWKEFGTQLLFDAIGGAITGGLMGGMAKSVHSDTNTQTTEQTTPRQTTEAEEALLNNLSQYDNAQIKAINDNALLRTLSNYDAEQANSIIQQENEGIRAQNAQIQEAQAEQRFANGVWDEASERAYNARSINQFKKQNAAWLRQNGYSSADATNLWNSIHKDIDAHTLTDQEKLALNYDSKSQFREDLVAQSNGEISYAEAGEIYDSARNKNRWNDELQAARERTRTASENPLVNATLQNERAEFGSQNLPLNQTSAVETNNVSTETTPLATEPRQTASAPRVSEVAQNTPVNQATQTTTAETQTTPAEPQAYRPVGQSEDVREHSTSQRIRERKTYVHDGLVAETEADPGFYKVRHNKDTIAKAEAVLFKADGTEADLNDVVDHASNVLYDARENNKKIKPEDVLITVQAADRLIEHAEALEKQGLTEEAQAERARSDKLMKALYAEQAEAGQLSQVSRLISRASPATQREMRQDYLNRCIKDWNSKLTKAQGRKMESKTGSSTISLPTELSEAYVNAKTDADLQKAYGDIVSYVGKNTPSNFYQQITALRFLNMLGNPVTQGRNIIGNSLNFVNYFVKRRMQTAIESMVTPGQKTFAMGYDLKDFGDWMQATSDPELAARLENNGRYQDVRNMNKSQFARDSADNQTIFKDKAWEGYRNITNKATTGGDIIFLKANFADAAAAYAKAHGFTFATATAEQKAAAIEVAAKEAQEATFHDDTVVSDMVTRLHANENSEWARRNRINYAATRVVNALGDGLLPFRKTPANVLVRGEEFSPLGLLNTAVKAVARHNDIKKTGTSEITTSDIINQFSKSLTGTGLTILGAALSAAGKARTSDDEDKDLNNYEKLNGKQDYAIKIGKTWATADWGAPDSIPFFMGVELYDALHGNANFTEDDIINIIGSLTGTMTEMSMLQGINDTMKGLDSYGADDNALMKFVTALGTSYLQQMLGNSLFSRLESAATPYRQETYINPDSKLSKERQYAIGKLSNKIPFWDYQQADYIDPWGNKQLNQDTNNPLLRGVRAVGSPAYISEEKTTKFDNELMELHKRLEDTDFKGDVLPSHIGRDTTVGDKRLTPEEYEKYATEVGQMKREMAEAFWNSSARDTLDDKQTGEVLKQIYEYCESRGAADILKDRGKTPDPKDSWADEAEHFGDDVNALSRFLATKQTFKDNLAEGDYDAIDSFLKTIDTNTNDDGNFTDPETQYFADEIDGFDDYVYAAQNGVDSAMLSDAKDIYKFYYNQKDLTPEQKTSRFLSAIADGDDTADWTDRQKDVVADLLKYYNMSPVNTERHEKLDNYGLEASNISSIESQMEKLKATDEYKALNDTQKKYAQYDIVLQEAAKYDDPEQAIALVKGYGTLRPGTKKLKAKILTYFADKDEAFQEELYNAVCDENGWKHSWSNTKPDYS